MPSFRFLRLASVLLLSALLVPAFVQADDEKKPAKEKPAAEKPAADKSDDDVEKPAAPDRAALEKEFEKKMSGCKLVGFFSVTGEEKGAPKEESYTIAKVTKLKDDFWLFATRVQYGKTDVTVPLALRVVWAEDTPIITLTDFTIPGMGTFTSRVMIYGDRYAGTWQHGEAGGHLWGRVDSKKAEEKPAKKEEKAKPADEKPAEEKSDK